MEGARMDAMAGISWSSVRRVAIITGYRPGRNSNCQHILVAGQPIVQSDHSRNALLPNSVAMATQMMESPSDDDAVVFSVSFVHVWEQHHPLSSLDAPPSAEEPAR
jgi:hypothetical protein